ncbi:glycosyltransferase [Mucilaginibacter terrenus]|uniref:glycosyltransferase n=1 Tax=Mucilaginibacter terrenus TaxID=2482727 RepID=UPI001058C3E1|nr:glycosyltransferase [Mucilaginibacter terrenus]
MRNSLEDRGIELYAIELFGKGSPYTFDEAESNNEWWWCLFPQQSAPELNKRYIKNAVFDRLDILQADVVIGPSIVFYAGALGIAWAKKALKRFIMFDDAKPSQVKRNFLVQYVKNVMIGEADALWLPSASYNRDFEKFQKKGLMLFYGFATINNEVFNGIPVEKRLGNTIICVARLVPIKNLTGLLTAWQIVEGENTGYQLLIVGDGPERENLSQKIKDLQLQTVQLKKAIPNTQLPQYLQSASAFVLPSFSETWGLVVNEAMAAGLPVLLSKTINATEDLLQEGINGYSFNAFDIQDIARSILKFVTAEQSLKVSMSRKSLEIIDTMSYSNMEYNLIDALNKIMSKERKPSGVIGSLMMKFWHGRYNTTGWDKL